MTDHAMMDRLSDDGANEPLPAPWLQQWAPRSEDPLPDNWLDDLATWEPMPRRREIETRNKGIMNIVLDQLKRKGSRTFLAWEERRLPFRLYRPASQGGLQMFEHIFNDRDTS